MSTPPPAEEDPLEDGRQDAASPIAAELSPPDETPTDPYLSLMKEIVDTHRDAQSVPQTFDFHHTEPQFVNRRLNSVETRTD